MSKQISKEKLTEIMDQVQEETKKDFAKSIEEVFNSFERVSMDEFMSRILPQLLSTTYYEATTHAELLIIDVLKELDLLKIDDE
ncbi:hypothetical protein SAMN05421503_2470 [Terribacillus aidingensis]|uniref:Uncharacterized protein n=1 Tax=Terribacillus aidingensis TaxID=586416 RepID=A0A285NZB4_9BACI|nr:hypothetical protein [Terribacillus aidingensis]SNZ14548.1 hypothetical protein SAMN05421503_2470 [Terribacillus aidingensis]